MGAWLKADMTYITVLEIDAIITVLKDEGASIPDDMTIYRKRQLVEALRQKMINLNLLDFDDG